MKETRIYVGLNDSVTKEQRFSIEKYKSVLMNICKSYHVPFSVSVSEGGYFHEDGQYTQENTLILTLIDCEETLIEEIAKDLCVFFHQESVLVTEDKVRAYFIQEEALLTD